MYNYDDVKNVTIEKYFENNNYAVDMFRVKYAHTKENGEKETPAEVFWRIASELAKFENKENQEFYKNTWFSLMYEGWFRPGGSIISGLGSGRKSSLANCTTIPIEGDTIEDISKAEYTLMKCAAYRQGMGIDLSNLRPRGSKLGNAAEESTGIIPWGEKYSDVGKYVGQRGRMPALLLSLKDHHPDIEEFINCKIQSGKIENANISVQISDKFMKALENREEWELWFDTERENIRKKVDPETIFDQIADAASTSAEPGVQFIDRLREGTISNAVYESTGNDIYKVISTNACCFTDDMIVTTDKGDLSISEIRKIFNNGDSLKILSYDMENKNMEFQELEDFHIRNDEIPQETIEICIENEDGSEIIIECTHDHKIYTKNRGYVKAIELTDDDILLEK